MTLRLGLVGCGRWGRHILRDLVSLGAETHVVALSAENRSEALARGAASVVDRIALLPTPIDGFVVASPTATHASVIESLLPTGHPIFVEKPMTSDLAAARRIAATAGERVFVMDKWRYHPGIEALALSAKSGELGRILAVRSYRLGWGNPHLDSDALWQLMPHDLSIVLEILGHLPAAQAVWTPIPTRPRSDVIAMLSDGDGPQATIEIATSHPVNRRSVLVVGMSGSAQLGGSYDDRIVLAGHTPNGVDHALHERPVANEMPLLRELRAFLGHLRGGPPPRSSAAEGLLVVERIAALQRLAGLPE